MQSRPNLLVLMVDQLNGTFFPDGPADFLHAPHLEALGQRAGGVAQNKTPSPLSSPARAAVM